MIANLDTLFHSCTPNIGVTTMAAIVKTESGGNPWSIGDNTITLRAKPRSKEEAITKANELIAQGHNIDLGLAQINSNNLKWLGLTVEQVFDPCTNLKAGAKILADAYQRAVTTHGPGQSALLAALSAYNTGSLTKGFSNGYVTKVANNAGVKVEIAVPNINSGANSKLLEVALKSKLDVYASDNGVANQNNKKIKTTNPYTSPLDAYLLAKN